MKGNKVYSERDHFITQKVKGLWNEVSEKAVAKDTIQCLKGNWTGKWEGKV